MKRIFSRRGFLRKNWPNGDSDSYSATLSADVSGNNDPIRSGSFILCKDGHETVFHYFKCDVPNVHDNDNDVPVVRRLAAMLIEWADACERKNP